MTSAIGRGHFYAIYTTSPKETAIQSCLLLYEKTTRWASGSKKTYVDDDRKTPFAKIEVRSGNCTNKQRQVIQNERQ